MGVVDTIDGIRYPRQGKLLGKKVSVCFHYDTTWCIDGVCIRDDMEAPFETIFRLSDDRIIRAVECQYSYDT